MNFMAQAKDRVAKAKARDAKADKAEDLRDKKKYDAIKDRARAKAAIQRNRGVDESISLKDLSKTISKAGGHTKIRKIMGADKIKKDLEKLRLNLKQPLKADVDPQELDNKQLASMGREGGTHSNMGTHARAELDRRKAAKKHDQQQEPQENYKLKLINKMKKASPAAKKALEAPSRVDQKPVKEDITPHAEVVKAYKKVLDAEHKHSESGMRSDLTAVKRASTHLSKKIKQHHPDCSSTKDNIALRTKLQSIKEISLPWKKPKPKNDDLRMGFQTGVTSSMTRQHARGKNIDPKYMTGRDWSNLGKKKKPTLLSRVKSILSKKKKPEVRKKPYKFSEDMSGMSVGSGHKRSVAQGAGMTKKGVDAYKRRNPGSKLQTAVTAKPSSMDPDSKPAKRRKAFCSRSQSWTSDRGKAARKRWNC